MYCPSCGTPLAEGLSFCNRCGADLKPSESLVSNSKPSGLGYVVAFGMILTTGITLGGLALVLKLVLELVRRNYPDTTVLAIVSLMIIFGSVALLSRQISRLIGVYLQPNNLAQPKRLKPTTLPAAAQLDVPRESVASVTEHTTRTFEPSYKERSR
ncbi:MAG: zinc ribbon domain-containing protein [Pyrinomonadaceae bacterium]